MIKITPMEFGQVRENNHVVTITYAEVPMPETDCEKIEIEKPDMKVCLVFPKKTEEEAEIHKDVKAILSGALREQMKHKLH